MSMDYRCQKKKVEEDVPALKTALDHRYNDSKILQKSAEEYWLRPSYTLVTTSFEL